MPCLLANFLRCAKDDGWFIDCKYSTILLPLYVVLRGLDGFFAGLDVFVLPPPPFKLNAFTIPFACASPIVFKNALSFNNFASLLVSMNRFSLNIADILDSRKTWKLASFLPRLVIPCFLSTLLISLWIASRIFDVLDELLNPL